ncbi:MAG: carboxypeptidase-like regulatory domain-containing protein, partial [Dysgonamonadaceae bacterium]|nr:carboxypeptidase-like regulatory domain-containing protein [Dysgonamonadaceae bacterium]
MRLTIYILLLFSGFTFAGNVHSQNAKVSLDKQQAPLKEVLDEIERQTDYLFISNTDVSLERKVSIHIQNKPVQEALNQLLENTGLTYALEGVNILIKKKESPSETATARQQSKKRITGVVTDENGEPVIGANVIEKGTSNGVVTDADGKFTLNVASKALLQVSYIGYTPQEIAVENRTDLKISLDEDNKALDEVVVVGYGTQRKSTLTGSIATVKSEKLTVAPVTNITNTLGGQLPGLTAKQTRGWPGEDGSTLRIRGGDTNPLVIVDGVETGFDHLDASQVESVTILKDGSASIYGARAGNGVILVTTKRGIDSKPVITLNSSVTMQSPTHIFP